MKIQMGVFGTHTQIAQTNLSQSLPRSVVTRLSCSTEIKRMSILKSPLIKETLASIVWYSDNSGNAIELFMTCLKYPPSLFVRLRISVLLVFSLTTSVILALSPNYRMTCESKLKIKNKKLKPNFEVCKMSAWVKTIPLTFKFIRVLLVAQVQHNSFWEYLESSNVTNICCIQLGFVQLLWTHRKCLFNPCEAKY